ncbi:MAG: MATE family efflux transporter, partial [Bacteroidota bacterium]|nr:MATE family efflux transporter [Bacteroidota bacterium]
MALWRNSIKKFYLNFLLAIKGTHTEFTSGSIRKAIFLLAVPMILEMVMEALFAVVDIFFVGQISTNAVATVGLTESVLTLIYAVAIGLSMAATALVARRVGEKDFKRAGNAAFQAIFIAIIISLLIGIPGFLYADEVLRIMGGTEELIKEGFKYTRLMFASNISIMLLFLINAIFRGAGNAAIAMRSLWVANGLNIVLDPLFIFGWGIVPAFGIEGAAIATTIGRFIGVLYQLYYLLGSKGTVRISYENLVLRWKTIRNLIDLSIGAMGQFLVESASWIFLVKIISMFGSEVLAGYTISIRIIIFSILPSWGLSNAAATIVGQNLGASQPDRAEKSVWITAHYNMVFLVVLSIFFFIWAEAIVGIFSPEPAVILTGVNSLRII